MAPSFPAASGNGGLSWESHAEGCPGLLIELLSLAEDGQHMFLHPVNVRCLVREYGSLEQSPEKISATVVEIAGYSMSEVRLSVCC